MRSRDHIVEELKQTARERRQAHGAYVRWIDSYDPQRLTQDQVKREQNKEAGLRANLAMCERRIIQLAEELADREGEAQT